MKPHEIRQHVDDVVRMAARFRDSKQLRERIADFLIPLLEQVPDEHVRPDDMPERDTCPACAMGKEARWGFAMNCPLRYPRQGCPFYRTPVAPE